MADALTTVRYEIGRVLDRTDPESVAGVAGQLLSAGRVFTAGEEGSGLVARAFAMRLMRLGLDVFVVGETITPGFAAGDLLVAVSGPGTTVATIRHAEQMRRSSGSVLAVTTAARSPLAALADRTLLIPAASRHRAASETTTEQPPDSLFDQCVHLVFDAVCLEIARRQAVPAGQTRTRHVSR